MAIAANPERVEKGTSLARGAWMPIAKSPSNATTHDHDAPGASSATRDEVARRPLAPESEPLDAMAGDPYDNVACTD